MKQSVSIPALLLGLLPLSGSDLAAQEVAPNAFSVVADSGMVTLGPNQMLRLTRSSQS